MRSSVEKLTNNNIESREPLKVHRTEERKPSTNNRASCSATWKLKSLSWATYNCDTHQPITRRVFFSQRPNFIQWCALGGGEILDALRLVIDASLVAKFSTWRSEAEWDSSETIHCAGTAGAGPTILALRLWSSQAKYSRRQVFLSVKRGHAFTSQKVNWAKWCEMRRSAQISTLSVNSRFSWGGIVLQSADFAVTPREKQLYELGEKNLTAERSLALPRDKFGKAGGMKRLLIRFVKHKRRSGLWEWRLFRLAPQRSFLLSISLTRGCVFFFSRTGKNVLVAELCCPKLLCCYDADYKN